MHCYMLTVLRQVQRSMVNTWTGMVNQEQGWASTYALGAR